VGEADHGKHEEAHDDEQDQTCRTPIRDEAPAALTRQAIDHLADLLMFARDRARDLSEIVAGGCGDVATARGQGPAGDARCDLLDLPVGCLLGPMVRPAAGG
jgi:hypothetical protein